MAANSSIEWTDRTWNPVRGCSVISPWCVNCYAMKQAHRFSGPGRAYEELTKLTKAGPQWTGVIRTVDQALAKKNRKGGDIDVMPATLRVRQFPEARQ